jgi:hypothetical protein
MKFKYEGKKLGFLNYHVLWYKQFDDYIILV